MCAPVRLSPCLCVCRCITVCIWGTPTQTQVRTQIHRDIPAHAHTGVHINISLCRCVPVSACAYICMCRCVSVYLVYIYRHRCAHKYIHTQIHMGIHLYTQTRVCTHRQGYICIHRHRCVCRCTCLCICVCRCTHLCVSVYVCVCTHLHWGRQYRIAGCTVQSQPCLRPWNVPKLTQLIKSLRPSSLTCDRDTAVSGTVGTDTAGLGGLSTSYPSPVFLGVLLSRPWSPCPSVSPSLFCVGGGSRQGEEEDIRGRFHGPGLEPCWPARYSHIYLQGPERPALCPGGGHRCGQAPAVSAGTCFLTT